MAAQFDCGVCFTARRVEQFGFGGKFDQLRGLRFFPTTTVAGLIIRGIRSGLLDNVVGVFGPFSENTMMPVELVAIYMEMLRYGVKELVPASCRQDINRVVKTVF